MNHSWINFFKGRIKHYNSNFSYIFGYTNLNGNHTEGPSSLSSMSALSVLNGKEITELIPSMKIPMSTILKVRKILNLEKNKILF